MPSAAHTYRLFLVEDDEALASALKEQLEAYGFTVVRATDYANVPGEFSRAAAHLAILDVNLPKFDGFAICRRLREITEAPILFVSARDSSMDQVMGLTVGGDDYLTKPFAPEVLVAKVQAMLRRAYEMAGGERELVEHDGLILDVQSATIRTGDRQVELTRNEFVVLFTLLNHHGRIVGRVQLMEALWNTNTFVDENTLNVNVNRVRKRLAEIGRDNVIQTQKGQGYIIR
ncbi:MAG: response regulator transcription factor [Spirochaetales bacterium]